MHIIKHDGGDRKLSSGIAPVFMVLSSYWHIRRKYDAFVILFSVFNQSIFYPSLFSEISYEKIYILLVFSYLMKLLRSVRLVKWALLGKLD
jgi:hypothetical protein